MNVLIDLHGVRFGLVSLVDVRGVFCSKKCPGDGEGEERDFNDTSVVMRDAFLCGHHTTCGYQCHL